MPLRERAARMFVEPARSRGLLIAWLVAEFVLSAVTDVITLVLAWGGALALLRRDARRFLVRALVAVFPLTATLVVVGVLFSRHSGVGAEGIGMRAQVGVMLRVPLMAFLSLAIVARVRLARALECWPLATRLLGIALAQIYALRLVVVDSRLGLRSRLPCKPGTIEILRGAGSVSGALLALSARNSRDVGDALRSRGL